MDARESDPLVSTIQWLEEEHRQGKATTFKVQQQIDQVQAGLWAQGDRVHQLEQAIAAISAQSTRISKLEDELRHTRDVIEQLQEAGSADTDRWAAAERARLADQERDRQEMAQIFQKLENAEREGQFLRNRLGVVDETVRRIQENIALLVGRVDDLAREDEQTQARIAGVLDQLRRKDQEISRLDHEQDALRKQDELQLNRLQIMGEQLRRVEDMGAIRELEGRLSTEFTEKLDLQRMERQRLERTVADMGLYQEQQRARVEEVAQLSAQVDAKVSSQADYVNQLREQVWSLRDDMATQFTEAIRSEEQQKRRMLADLEQQLLELKNRAARVAARPNA